MGGDEPAMGQQCGGAGARGGGGEHGGAHRHVWALKLGESPETRHGRRIASHRIACTESGEVQLRGRAACRPGGLYRSWQPGARAKHARQGRRFSASMYAVGPTVLRRVMLRRQVMLLRRVLLLRRILLRRRWLLGVAAKRRLLQRHSAARRSLLNRKKRSAPGRSGLVLPQKARAMPRAARARPALHRWRPHPSSSTRALWPQGAGEGHERDFDAGHDEAARQRRPASARPALRVGAPARAERSRRRWTSSPYKPSSRSPGCNARDLVRSSSCYEDCPSPSAERTRHSKTKTYANGCKGGGRPGGGGQGADE